MMRWWVFPLVLFLAPIFWDLIYGRPGFDERASYAYLAGWGAALATTVAMIVGGALPA